MVEQVEILKAQYQRKIGYGEDNGNKLLKFLTDNPGLPGVYIPPHCFQDYVEVFNAERQKKEQA